MSNRDYDAPPIDRIYPTPEEMDAVTRDLGAPPHQDEFDGPDDLELDETEITRARVPSVNWPKDDRDAPDFAHLLPGDGEHPVGAKSFRIGAADIMRLVKANGFEPKGPEGTFVFAFRGAILIDRDDGKNDGVAAAVDTIMLEETRPDHRDFRCVIGFCNTETGKLSAFRASTVPNVKYLTNYYLTANGLGGSSSTSANMLPTGCYVYRVGAHSGGKIYPALRLTDPQKITEDGTVCVYRTTNDLTFKTDDVFHVCTPYDNIHCAYDFDSFASAGCQTIQGPNKQGPWGAFQAILRRWKAGTRIDYVLLTGREAAIAAHVRETAKGKDEADQLLERLARRLRPGSNGDAVKRLQQQLGMEPSGYFSANTKAKLAAQQRSKAIASDGIWSPALERALGWAVLTPPAAEPKPPAQTQAPAASDAPTAAVSSQAPVPKPADIPAPPPEAAHEPAGVQPEPETDLTEPEAPASAVTSSAEPTVPEATSAAPPVQVAQVDTTQRTTRSGAPLPEFDAPPRDALLPDADVVARGGDEPPHPHELDGPDDLPEELAEVTRGVPSVSWPKQDKDAPDYAHLEPAGREPVVGDKRFRIAAADMELLIKANAFDPKGPDGRIVFGFRGATIVDAGKQDGAVIDADSIELEETRPDHRNFRCVIGYYQRGAAKLSAFTASTVPNVKYLTNYYLWMNKLGGNSGISANMMPTGCYVFRIGSHSGGKIRPALRMTDPDNLADDAKACVLRTSNDLTLSHDDLFDYCMPYDNIHCAYEYDAFSSAGCQTIQGPNGKGPWGRFQDVLEKLKVNTRLDYMLLTGRDASIAAWLRDAGKAEDQDEILRRLGRLRVGSLGAAVDRLQEKIGVKPSGYFGPYTKKKLVEFQRSKGLVSDGVWSPALDAALGWSIMTPPPAPAPEPVEPKPAPASPEAAPTVQTPPGSAAVASTGTATAAPSTPTAQASAGSPPLEQFNTVLSPATPVAPGTVIASATGATEQAPVVSRSGAVAPPRSRDAQAAMPIKRPLEITPDNVAKFAPRAIAAYREAFISGNDLLTRYGINQSPMRLCHFLGQIGNECGRLRIIEENMNYRSAARIRAVWPTRFPTLASAEPFVNNPEGLAEKVYGGRFENGPGDGWRYRGRGLVQITGRSSYREMGRKLGIPLEEKPELACEPKYALAIACETWAGKQLAGERDMNRLADINKIEALTYRINGGYTNLDDRRAAFEEAWEIWGSGAPPKGALEDDTLERGDRSGRVEELNARLDELKLFDGITPRPPQHVYNKATYTAVRSLQQQMGVAPSGIVGAETWGVLEKALEHGGMPGRAATRAPPELSEVDERSPVREAVVRRLREIRAWSIVLPPLAAAFVVAYIFLLINPTGNAAIWLPLLFSGVVFVAGLALWLAARPEPHWRLSEPSRSRSPRTSSPEPAERSPGAFVLGEDEPVRYGFNLD
jgi:predicted chitinase/peptidoglycan hydrolase-like protein with peptidoglycan-binding domain